MKMFRRNARISKHPFCCLYCNEVHMGNEIGVILKLRQQYHNIKCRLKEITKINISIKCHILQCFEGMKIAFLMESWVPYTFITITGIFFSRALLRKDLSPFRNKTIKWALVFSEKDTIKIQYMPARGKVRILHIYHLYQKNLKRLNY